MPSVRIANCDLSYNVVDQRLPWLTNSSNIVFHHGVGACAAMWRGWFSTLGERHRLVTFDKRGHGRSTCPPDHHWDMPAMLADLDAVIRDSCGDASVHLVGESIGATVCLAYAMTWPERVRTLTISNGAHLGVSVEALDDWATTMRDDGMDGWSKMMMQRRFYPGALSKDAAAWFEAQQASADSHAILSAVEVLVGADLREDLPLANMPTLIMHPDASPFIPVPVVADLHSRLPDARLKVFAHAKHGLPFSHASVCAQTVRDFLSEVE